jgi:hypothetical protein
MALSTRQYDITPEQSNSIIIRYIRGHQGCTKADLTRGLKGIISKKTIDRLVAEKVSSDVIEIKKKKENSRNHELYLKEENILVTTILQLTDFGDAIEELFWIIVQNIIQIRTNQGVYQTYEGASQLDEANFYSLLQCINILDKVSYVYMTYSTLIWPRKIQDETTLRKLFSITFNKLADLRLYVSKTLMQYFSEIYSQIGNMPTLRETYGTLLFEESLERFNKANLEKESEPLILSMWKIFKDIEWWAFPEPRLYNWNFNYHEGYKKYLDFCKQYPKQRRDNYTPEDFRKYHERPTSGSSSRSD